MQTLPCDSSASIAAGGNLSSANHRQKLLSITSMDSSSSTTEDSLPCSPHYQNQNLLQKPLENIHPSVYLSQVGEIET